MDPTCYVKCSSLWILVSGKSTAWLFTSLLIPGDQTNKIKGYDGGIPDLKMKTFIYVNISCSTPVFN